MLMIVIKSRYMRLKSLVDDVTDKFLSFFKTFNAEKYNKISANFDAEL